MGSISEPTFVLGGVRIDRGCMNLTYCYFKVYEGTRNLKRLCMYLWTGFPSLHSCVVISNCIVCKGDGSTKALKVVVAP